MNDKHQPSVKKKESVFYAKLAKLEPITCKATVQISGLIYQSGRTPLLQTWLYISWFFTYTVSVFYLKSAQLQSENILNFTRQQIQLHPVIFWQISYSHSSHFSISVLNPKPRGAHQTFCWMSPRHMMLWIKAGAKRILLLCPSTSSHWSFDC